MPKIALIKYLLPHPCPFPKEGRVTLRLTAKLFLFYAFYNMKAAKVLPVWGGFRRGLKI
jgi:hypothetical protein